MIDSFQTLEIRWFFPGGIPPEVGEWFANLGEVQGQTPRTDLYLLGTGEALGVKLREGRIEMKQRTAVQGEVAFAPGVSGVVEGWAKWGFGLADALPDFGTDPYWAAVEKTRQIAYFRRDGRGRVVRAVPGRLPETGGGLELTAVRLDGQPWWTIGVEVFGPAQYLYEFLSEIAAENLVGLPQVKLDAQHSFGYPVWLQAHR